MECMADCENYNLLGMAGKEAEAGDREMDRGQNRVGLANEAGELDLTVRVP